MLNSRALTSGFKKIRHDIDGVVKQLPLRVCDLLRERKSLKDVGSSIIVHELRRKDVRDIFCANIQRVKESTRVLEEFSKLISKKCSLKFKKIRYDTYEIEKKATQRISRLMS